MTLGWGAGGAMLYARSSGLLLRGLRATCRLGRPLCLGRRVFLLKMHLFRNGTAMGKCGSL